MDFISYSQSWSKSEVLQGKIMIGIGLLVLIALVFILKSEHELLRGSLIPLSLLVLILIGYGGFILYDRPSHSNEAIVMFKSSPDEAVKQEVAKHINDNKAGKTLMKYVYPGLILVSTLVLFLVSSAFYQGLSLGFILVFTSTYIIDYGFVSRSEHFIEFLNQV